MTLDQKFYKELMELYNESRVLDVCSGDLGRLVKKHKLENFARKYNLFDDDVYATANNLNTYIRPLGLVINVSNNTTALYGEYVINLVDYYY